MSAVDILCVQDDRDNVIRSSPFFVRFETYAKQRTKVIISINETELDIDNFVVEKGDYHGRFQWSEHRQWTGSMWPFFTAWADEIENLPEEQQKSYKEAFMLRLVPTYEFIQRLGLNMGMNKISFRYGNEVAHCRVFLWNGNHRVVVSDIDGTITNGREALSRFSDTYTKYMYGKHAREGVAQLYGSIEKNGYQIFYLTGRPIVQASLMREFVEGIRQTTEGHKMPTGPIFTTPYRMYIARAYKVWRGEPDEFKTTMLKAIRELFHHSAKDPLAAGFGNTKTDITSYMDAGIPPQKCFIVRKIRKHHCLPWHQINKDVNTISTADESFADCSAIGKVINEMFPQYQFEKEAQEVQAPIEEKLTRENVIEKIEN
jgi:phosphatidate phosphatase PAH1